jgi:enoyl-CoA hydratase/carnithine racemase
VSQVVPAERVGTAAMELAEEMASKAPIALRYAKEAINNGMDLTLMQGLRLEADLYFLLHGTHDRIAGIRAFQKKKGVRFEGR